MHFDAAEIAYVPTTGVRRVNEAPLVAASDDTLQGYGCLVDAPESFPIEIVRWPAQGWRPIDENSGDQGGVTEGVFEFSWKGETLYARNNAVGDSCLFAWSNWPEEAATEGWAKPRHQALVWRANYHPDSGQLFYPLHGESFVVPLALPGDDVTPEQFVTFWCDGRRGLYIHPKIGKGRSCRSTTMPSFWTDRAVCMPAYRSISQRSSAAISACRCNGAIGSAGTENSAGLKRLGGPSTSSRAVNTISYVHTSFVMAGLDPWAFSSWT